MRPRRKLLPSHLSDMTAFLCIIAAIIATFAFEVFLVIPTLYNERAAKRTHQGLGFLLFSNVAGNFLGLWLTDTSVYATKSEQPVLGVSNALYCPTCRRIAPARSYHCPVCDVCILKRSHHCIFAGACVGHRNMRYFFFLLFHLWISVIYCTYFNTIFLSANIQQINGLMLLKFAVPLMCLLFMDFSWLQLYVFFWSLHAASALLTTYLLVFHGKLILSGATCYEAKWSSSGPYDKGWRANVEDSLGARWILAAVFPMAKSTLPGDGVHWEKAAFSLTSQHLQRETRKRK